MDRLELELLLMEHPAPLSEELTRLCTLPPELELRTDSMLDMADEQDSLSPLKFKKNRLCGFIFLLKMGAGGPLICFPVFDVDEDEHVTPLL